MFRDRLYPKKGRLLLGALAIAWVGTWRLGEGDRMRPVMALMSLLES